MSICWKCKNPVRAADGAFCPACGAALKITTEQDYYFVLGVVPQATLAELREAYGRKIMAATPKLGAAADHLLPIILAWQLLSDPKTRALYDDLRAPGNPVLREEWNRVFQRAAIAAEEGSRNESALKQDYFTQLNLAAEQVQAHPAGRAAAAGIAGLIVGGGVGAGAGYYVGVGPLGGAIAGMIAGAIAGAVFNFRGGSNAVPKRN